jgi:hypothetical protein
LARQRLLLTGYQVKRLVTGAEMSAVARPGFPEVSPVADVSRQLPEAGSFTWTTRAAPE